MTDANRPVRPRLYEVSLDMAVYFAPRGRRRLTYLGGLLAQRYLTPDDLVIGLVGDAGAGKSLLIRGMFPGLVLTNDDEGINVRPLPVLQDAEDDNFRTSTYHIDVRFESAFNQPGLIAEAVRKAVRAGRRVVIEHFELLYPFLKYNAEILIGIGEEVILTRPDVFGPEPSEIAHVVFESLKYRKMAHTAEDLTAIVFEEMGLEPPHIHSEVKRGFVVEFPQKPDIDLEEVERRVKRYIESDCVISYCSERQIRIGDKVYPCSGPRLHVRRAGEIENFKLVKEFRYSPLTKLYLLVGLVGQEGGEARGWSGGPTW